MVAGSGRFGVYRGRPGASISLAITLESLGYATVWLGNAEGDLRLAEQLLAATSTLQIATGIVNIWNNPAPIVAESFHRLDDQFPGRFLLGLGVGHGQAVGERYSKPYQAMQRYLDELDAAGLPLERRVLAALGPAMLKLAADRAAGAHPYLVTPEHTRRARLLLGSGRLLVPEQKVVLESDPARAEAIGRAAVAPYLGLTNYTNNLRRLGFDSADLAGAGSDRLIDALAAAGDPVAVGARLHEHLDAGADQVAIKLLGPDDRLVAGYARLAEVLFG